MLLTFASNSTLFTSLPLTIGLKCGLLRLTILLGMLSLLSLFRKWLFCWRYILVMTSSSFFSLTVNRFSAFSLHLSISRISFSILPSRSSSLRVIFLVWHLLCLRCFLYVRFAFCTSRNFVRGRWIPTAAQLAHRRIALLDPFPQQLRVSRITHLALIARRICVHRVQILHVRSPLVGEYALELLYLQLPCKFQHYVVQQLVVRQWACRIYYHVAEYLVVDVAVQLFHQFRAAESRVHLQEHQGHFPFRSEERPASQLRPNAFPYQTEVLCHLAEREQLLYPAKFALLES